MSAGRLSERFESPWLVGVDFARDGLISWRDSVARSLIDVSQDDVLGALVTAISEMEVLTTRRILDLRGNSSGSDQAFDFGQWLPHWQEHFRHWQDPVRDMLGNLCVTPDAQLFAQQLHAVDGQVLLDFLLAPCSAACRPWFPSADQEIPLYPDSPVSMIDNHGPGRMLEQLCLVLYGRFAEAAPFSCDPVPGAVDLGLNYDRLCPSERPWDTSRATEEGLPC